MSIVVEPMRDMRQRMIDVTVVDLPMVLKRIVVGYALDFRAWEAFVNMLMGPLVTTIHGRRWSLRLCAAPPFGTVGRWLGCVVYESAHGDGGGAFDMCVGYDTVWDFVVENKWPGLEKMAPPVECDMFNGKLRHDVCEHLDQQGHGDLAGVLRDMWAPRLP